MCVCGPGRTVAQREFISDRWSRVQQPEYMQKLQISRGFRREDAREQGERAVGSRSGATV